MAYYSDRHIFVTIHDMKTNISKYIRQMESGAYDAMVVKRQNKPVGLMLPYQSDEERARVKQAYKDRMRQARTGSEAPQKTQNPPD